MYLRKKKLRPRIFLKKVQFFNTIFLRPGKGGGGKNCQDFKNVDFARNCLLPRENDLVKKHVFVKITSKSQGEIVNMPSKCRVPGRVKSVLKSNTGCECNR